MNFKLETIPDNQVAGRVRFDPAGIPQPQAPPEVLRFLMDLEKVWLPTSKSIVPVDWTNEDHQRAAMNQLPTIGYRAVPEDALKESPNS